jgi:hypothetical protein
LEEQAEIEGKAGHISLSLWKKGGSLSFWKKGGAFSLALTDFRAQCG